MAYYTRLSLQIASYIFFSIFNYQSSIFFGLDHIWMIWAFSIWVTDWSFIKYSQNELQAKIRADFWTASEMTLNIFVGIYTNYSFLSALVIIKSNINQPWKILKKLCILQQQIFSQVFTLLQRQTTAPMSLTWILGKIIPTEIVLNKLTYNLPSGVVWFVDLYFCAWICIVIFGQESLVSRKYLKNPVSVQIEYL